MIPFARISKYGNKAPVPEGIKTINSFGLSHMFLTTSGDVYAYGTNMNGRFGTGDNANIENKPRKLISGVLNMYCHNYLTLLQMMDGTFKACGNLHIFNLSTTQYTYTDVTSYFSTVGIIKKIDLCRVSAATTTIFVLNTLGTVYALGYGNRGQMGTGTNNSLGGFTQINTACSDLICTGIYTTVILKNDNTVSFSGGISFVNSTNDVTSFTNIGETGVQKIYGTGYNGELIYLKNDGFYVRGITGNRYGLVYNSTNRGLNLKATLPFAFDIQTFELYCDVASTSPSVWITNSLVHYGSGSSNINSKRMGFTISSSTGDTFTEQNFSNVPVPIVSVVSGNYYSALIGSNGVVYGAGGFGGWDGFDGSLVVNYPGNNPSYAFYDKLNLDI